MTTLAEHLGGTDPWEIHYAPINGNLALFRRTEMKGTDSWPHHHAWVDEFLKLRAAGTISRDRVLEYGHRFFHGHRGRVDVYTRI